MKTAKPNTAPLIFTTYDIGRMTGTDPTTVHKWIDKGLLRGYRTPGGHRRVRAEDLRNFLVAHRMPVPRELGGADALRVLVVDEDAESLKSSVKNLKRLKPTWDVSTAGGGIEALLLVASNAPDVLVLDLSLAEVDALALCKQLKARTETSAVNVVATAGRLTSDQERKAMGAGIAACVKKPIAGPELTGAIELAAGIAAAAIGAA